MDLLKFKVIYSFLWLISKLPWPAFYLLSDFVYFLMYYVIGYRKKTVFDNLKLSFPEKDDKELTVIAKKFYAHMCDMFMEMIKSITISHKETQKRYKFVNQEVLRDAEAKQKSIILLAAHYGNYEWSNCISLSTKKTVVGVYKPIKSNHFNEFAKKIRGRFGAEVIPSRKVMRHALLCEKNDPGGRLYGLIADQSPSKINEDSYFIPFMGHEVPVFVGGEVLAKKIDAIVAYMKVNKVKRGYYEIDIVQIDDNLKNNTDFEAMKSYYKILEEQINERPELYLWTHKRWKHSQKN